MTNQVDYVELGLACADVCTALGRGMNGRRVDDLNQSVVEAIEQLTTWVEPAKWHTPGDLLTYFSIAGLWRRSRRRSSSEANEA